MGNAPTGKTTWFAHCSSFAVPLEFGNRVIVKHGDPPAELEPEASENPHVYYVNEEKYNAWKQGIITSIIDEYNEKLHDDLNSANANLNNFVATIQPGLLTPLCFAVVPYDTVMKLTSVKWAFPPEETFKGEDMLFTVWPVIVKNEDGEGTQTKPSESEPKPTLVYTLYPLNLSMIPESYIDSETCDFKKQWMLFVKAHHEQLKPILSHKRNNGVFTFVVRSCMPEEDTTKFEGEHDVDI
uniref:Uncharacterized protein n=1 Tax=Clandestinovirus TaxID=2831644 RepID=A0A8F8KP60_9VIRU|nr:hypothetical protein KOM_12_242 [Clandestinovirus]